MPEKSPFLFLSPLSLYLSLSVCFFLSFLSCLFPSSLFFFIPPNSLLSTLFAPIISSLFHFLLTSIFSFSFIFYFLPFSLFSSFLISFDFLLSGLIKVGETSPHSPHMPLVFFTQFPYFLIYFSFSLLHHSTHGSM